MRKITLLALILLIFSCKEKATTVIKKQEVETIQNFEWLLGTWQRTNEAEGKQTYENWHKKSATEYVGLGFTIKNKDTLSSEKMQLIKTSNEWNLVVSVVGKGDDTSATTFKMIKKGKESFTCENKEIDFPNTIHYEKNNKNIKALIRGGDMEILFEFKRLKNE